MGKTLFFSWQADTPSRVGRGFLKQCLEEVCQNLTADTDIDEAHRDMSVDSDTQGVAGQPPIVETIFRKIDEASVFFADLTFVGTRLDERPAPNPNVLIEYGWALKSLKHERVICVMNTGFGVPTAENMPFDLRHVRWPIQYSLPDSASADDIKKEKRKVVAALTTAIRACIATIPEDSKLSNEFPAAATGNDKARFRNSNEELGFTEGFFDDEPKKVMLTDGPAIWLRVMPFFSPSRTWPVHELKELFLTDPQPLPITFGNGCNQLRAEDGVGMYRPLNSSDNPQLTDSVAFMFETGEIWSVDTHLLTRNDRILFFLEEQLERTLLRDIQFLKRIGAEPPYRVIAGVTGIKGRAYNYPLPPNQGRVGLGPICAANIVEEKGVYMNGAEPIEALRPFFEALFNKCAMQRPAHLR